MSGPRSMLFRLREYDDAFRDVFGRVIRARAEEAFPLLKEIPTEPRSAIHTSQVTLPSGEALTNEPFEMKVAFRFNLSDMVTGNIDAFTTSVQASGREYGEQTMRQLLKYSGSISEAMGNAVAGKGRQLGWPVILEVLEGIEIDFDEKGHPELPQMISDRDISKVVPYPIVSTPCRSVGAGPGLGVIAGTITARSAAGVGSSGSSPASGRRTRP